MKEEKGKVFVLCGFLGATLIAFLKNPETLDLIDYIQHACIAPKPRSQNKDHQNNEQVEGHHPPPPNDSPRFVGFLSFILCTHKKPKKKHSTKVEFKILSLTPSITQSTYVNWSRLLLMILATLLRLGRLYITQNAQKFAKTMFHIIIIIVTSFQNPKLLCYKTNMFMDGYVAKLCWLSSTAMEVV